MKWDVFMAHGIQSGPIKSKSQAIYVYTVIKHFISKHEHLHFICRSTNWFNSLFQTPSFLFFRFPIKIISFTLIFPFHATVNKSHSKRRNTCI